MGEKLGVVDLGKGIWGIAVKLNTAGTFRDLLKNFAFDVIVGDGTVNNVSASGLVFEMLIFKSEADALEAIEVWSKCRPHLKNL